MGVTNDHPRGCERRPRSALRPRASRRNARGGPARDDLPLSRRYATSNAFTLKTDVGRGYLDQGTGALLVLGRLRGGGARVGNRLHAAHRAGRRATRARPRDHGARRARARRHWCAHMARRTPRPAAHPGEPSRRARGDRPPCRKRGREHLGFRRHAPRRADRRGAKRPTAQCRPSLPTATPLPGASSSLQRPTATARHRLRQRASSTGWWRLDRSPDEPVAVPAPATPRLPRPSRDANEVADAARGEGLGGTPPPRYRPHSTSPQDFARWAGHWARRWGIDLDLVHRPVHPATQTLTLLSRRDGATDPRLQAATAIRASPCPPTFWQRLDADPVSPPVFEAGDLVGILPRSQPRPAPLLARLRTARRLRRVRGQAAAGAGSAPASSRRSNLATR